MQQLLKNRLVTVDALRGFALLGIMLAHFIFWYTAGPLPQEVYGKYQDAGSQVANIFTELFVRGKFFAFFSFLFGLSFYLQMRGLENNSRTFIARYAWLWRSGTMLKWQPLIIKPGFKSKHFVEDAVLSTVAAEIK